MANTRDNPNSRINMRQEPYWTRVSQPTDYQQVISASVYCGYGTQHNMAVSVGPSIFAVGFGCVSRL